MADISEDQGELNEAFEMMAATDTPPPPDDEPIPPPLEEPPTPPPLSEDQDTPPPTLDNFDIPPPPDEMPPPLPMDEAAPPDDYEVDPDMAVDDQPPDNSELRSEAGENIPEPIAGTSPSPSFEREGGSGVPSTSDASGSPQPDPEKDLAHVYDVPREPDITDVNNDGDGYDLLSPVEPASPSALSDPEDQGESSGIHNASTLPSTRPMSTANNHANSKENGHAEMTPEETKAAMKSVGKYRREAVMWVIIFILAAGFIAVVFYFAYSIAVAQSDPLPDGAFNIRVSLTLDNNWSSGFEVSSSPNYINLANEFITGVNRTLLRENSTFVDVYKRAEVFSFSDESGKIRTSFRCYFLEPPSKDISSQGALTDTFEPELRAGFDDGYFGTLTLKDDAPFMFIEFIAT